MRYLLVLALLLSGCGDYAPEDQTMAGVSVTDNVPFASESNQDITDRGDWPSQGDRVIPSHLR